MALRKQLVALFLISLLAGDCIAGAASRHALPLLLATLSARSASAVRPDSYDKSNHKTRPLAGSDHEAHYDKDHALLGEDAEYDADADDGALYDSLLELIQQSQSAQGELYSLNLSFNSTHRHRFYQTQATVTSGAVSQWIHNWFTESKGEKADYAIDKIDWATQSVDNTNNLVGAFIDVATTTGQVTGIMGVVLGTYSMAMAAKDVRALKQDIKRMTQQPGDMYDDKIALAKCLIWNKKKDGFIALASTGAAACATAAAFSAPGTFGASLAVPAAAAAGVMLAVSLGNLYHEKKFKCKKVKKKIALIEAQQNLVQQYQTAQLADAANRLMMQMERQANINSQSWKDKVLAKVQEWKQKLGSMQQWLLDHMGLTGESGEPSEDDAAGGALECASGTCTINDFDSDTDIRPCAAIQAAEERVEELSQKKKK